MSDPTPRRAHLSVSKSTYEKLKQRADETGCPMAILVEIAISPTIGAPLSATAKEWQARLRTTKRA